MGEVIEDALQAQARRRAADVPIEALPVYGGSGLLPGVALGDNAVLRDVMDGDEPLDARR